MTEKQQQEVNFTQRRNSLFCRLGFHDFDLDLSDLEGRLFGCTIRRYQRCGKRQAAEGGKWHDL